MQFPDDEIEELIALWPGAQRFEEQGITYFLLPDAGLPDGCAPGRMDLLLCPMSRDSYPCRVFFSQMPTSSKTQNWNHTNIRIIERNWHAFSWKIGDGPHRLAQIVSGFLKALR